MISLYLNEGWCQIPPDQDGVYWFANAKSWHSENAYESVMLVDIKDGKRISEMENYDRKWHHPDYGSDCPIWDSNSQFEMLAAWRLKMNDEDFDHLPPKILGIIFERHPVSCPECGNLAAIYRAWKEEPGKPTIYEFPCVCYFCFHMELMNDFYSLKRIGDYSK